METYPKLAGNAIKQILDNGKDVWYADSGITASGIGTTWSTAFKTITEAVAAASAGDAIILKGEFDEGAPIVLSVELSLIGQNTSSNQNNTLIQSAGAAHVLIDVEANNCKIWNIGFAQTTAETAIEIGDGAGDAWWKLHIKGCKFDLFGTGTTAITSTAVGDAPDLHIEDCLFRSFATSAIVSNFTRAKINNNTFIVPTAKTAIVHDPNTGSRPDTRIFDNQFITVDSTDGIGITVTNAPTAGFLDISGNQFVNFADYDHCISKRLTFTGVNYLNSAVISELIVSKTYADLTGYDTAVAFTVTGDIMVRIFGVVGATAITSTSGTTTISLGTTQSVDGIIAATTIDNSDFDATDVWTDNSPTDDIKAINGDWFLVGGGADIILTRNVDDLTAGILTLYAEWKPVSSDGNLVAA